jgi:hypothetical protein
MWQWREPFDSLLWLAAGGMTGTLARMGLVELFRCYSTAVSGAACRSLDDGALFLVLAPNMCGCFIAGLLSTPAGAGVASDGGDVSYVCCVRARGPGLTPQHH